MAIAGRRLALGLATYAALPGFGSPLFMLKATIFGRLPEFLAGAIFAWASPRGGRGWATSGGVASLLLVLMLLIGVQYVTHKTSINSYAGVLVNNWLLPLATGWLLHGLASEPTRLGQFLSTAPAQALGRASYCFYLLHMGILPNALAPLLQALGCLERPAHRWLLARLAQPAALAVPMRAPVG